MRVNRLTIRQLNKCKSHGMVVIMLLVGMTVLLSIIGLAIDFGHAYLNKTRLQGLTDSLVLSGAKTLNDSRSTGQANSEISSLFTLNINSSGNRELKENLEVNDLNISYSDTLSPFVSGGSDPRYVRVQISSMTLQSWFIQLLGFSEIPMSAVSVAGPSGSFSSMVCNPSAVMLCGNPDEAPSSGNGSYWGYVPGAVQLLKAGSNNDSCLGSGNFQLVSIGSGNGGANEVKEVLAGNYAGCVDFGGGITTKPGNTVGPSIQGLNTRFGEYLGAMKSRSDEFPPDVITTDITTSINFEEGSCTGGQTTELDFSWPDYQQAVSASQFNNPPPLGVIERRVLKVPIGDCSDPDSLQGRTTIPYLGLGCFFLLKKVTSSGQDKGNIYGEFIEECQQDGVVGQQSNNEDGPYKITLHDN
jgi:hypothetical protein